GRTAIQTEDGNRGSRGPLLHRARTMAPAVRRTGPRSADRPSVAAAFGRLRGPPDVTSLASTAARGPAGPPLHRTLPTMVKGRLYAAADGAILVDQNPVRPGYDDPARPGRKVPDRHLYSGRSARTNRVRDGAAPGGSPPCVRTPGLWSSLHPDE